MKIVHKSRPVLNEEEKVFVRNIDKIREVNGKNASQLTNFLQKYVDTKIVICASCVAQFKFSIAVIKSFVSKWNIDLEPKKIEKEEEVDISSYHSGGAYWKFDDVTIKGKKEAIKYYLENVQDKG